MKKFHTATLERNKCFDSDFVTHPYECGWASEAIFFVDITEFKGNKGHIKFTVQISSDGIKWIDEGSEFVSKEAGLSFTKITHFGGWLRLKADMDGADLSVETTIHLAMKE